MRPQRKSENKHFGWNDTLWTTEQQHQRINYSVCLHQNEQTKKSITAQGGTDAHTLGSQLRCFQCQNCTGTLEAWQPESMLGHSRLAEISAWENSGFFGCFTDSRPCWQIQCPKTSSCFIVATLVGGFCTTVLCTGYSFSEIAAAPTNSVTKLPALVQLQEAKAHTIS